MSSHFTKSIVQKITPFLGVGVMSLCALWRQDAIAFTESAMLMLCGTCLVIIMLQVSRTPATPAPIPAHTHFSCPPFLMVFCIGLMYELFINISMHLMQTPSIHGDSVYDGSTVSLQTLFIVTWAILIQKAFKNHSDPVICYAYWPQSVVLRIPALLTYYASSNGLFILMLSTFFFFVFDHVIPFANFEALDTCWLTVYLTCTALLILYISSRAFQPTRPQIGFNIIFFFWIAHFCFIEYGSQLPEIASSFLEYKYKMLLLTSEMPVNLEEATRSLPLSLLVLWGVFWGSALSRIFSLRWSNLMILIMGQCAGLYLSVYQLADHITLFTTLFFGCIAFNIMRSASPIHAIDCPWRRSKRLALKPTRWLMSMGLSPCIFCILYGLSGKPAIFFLLHNFSLLTAIGLLYPLIYEMCCTIKHKCAPSLWEMQKQSPV